MAGNNVQVPPQARADIVRSQIVGSRLALREQLARLAAVTRQRARMAARVGLVVLAAAVGLTAMLVLGLARVAGRALRRRRFS